MSPRPKPSPPPANRPPRVFALYREDDVHGISGVGLIAWGVWFADGKAVVRWAPGRVGARKTEVWDSLEEIPRVHGHGGRTRIVWLGTDPLAERLDTGPVWARYEAYEAAAADLSDLRYLAAALAAVRELPGLLRAYDGLVLAHAELLAELAGLRAEHTAMQEALDAIADLTPPGGPAT